MTIATIRGVVVTQDEDGTVRWTSGAAVDADGANGQHGKPFAYRYPEDNGLDRLANAGWPNQDWRNVLYDDGTGHPLTNGEGDAYSKTSLVLQGDFLKDVEYEAVDAAYVPYVVVNPHVRMNASGVILGCRATITYNTRMIEAVVADVSGGNDIGEISVAAAQMLGIPYSPLTGGVDANVTFTLYPGTAAVVQYVTYPLQAA